MTQREHPEQAGTSEAMAAGDGRATGYRSDVLEDIYEGLREGGVDFAVFLPDSVLDPVAQLIVQREEIEVYQCSREDEGVAMAMGAYMVGKMPVVMMEGSGIGLSGLILARGMVQHTATLLLVSHSSTLGEAFDYHGATRLVAEPLLRALGIPCHTLSDTTEIKTALAQACRTVAGQQIPVGVLVPPYLVSEA